jgi:hypothetical protein
MITDYSNYTNRTKTPTRRGLTLLVMLPPFISISMAEPLHHLDFDANRWRNPSAVSVHPFTSPVHHDFDTSRWENPSATLFTSISMGEPFRCPRSPQFQRQQVEEPLHHLRSPGFRQGNPYITPISMPAGGE